MIKIKMCHFYMPMMAIIRLCYGAYQVMACLSCSLPLCLSVHLSLSVCLLACLSVCLPEDTLFHAITQNVLQLSSEMKPICFGVVTLIFKVTYVTKVEFGFWRITQKVLELST